MSLNTRYLARNTVRRVMRVVRRSVRRDRLFPHFLHPQSGRWEREGTYSLGAFADSFYEYLLKEWLRSGKVDKQVRLTLDDLQIVNQVSLSFLAV